MRKQVVTNGYRVILDLKNQVIGVDVSKEPTAPNLCPTIAPIVTGVFPRRKSMWGGALEFDSQPVNREEYKSSPAKFVSASALLAKAKQFDDGLFATVELALQQGSLSYSGKTFLLSAIQQILMRNLTPRVDESVGDVYSTLLAACTFEGIGGSLNLPEAWKYEVDSRLYKFLSDANLSKPIGFYSWSPDLQRLFKQDRMLQTQLRPGLGVDNIRKVIEGDPKLKRTYEHYLKMMSRLTNPLAGMNFLNYPFDPSRTTQAGPNQTVAFFPHSMSREEDLMMRLFGQSLIPDNFSLFDEIIRRLQNGEMSFAPRRDSGWYEYQTWALEPLVLHDQLPEASRVIFKPEYSQLLLELFKGAMSLTRETHAKQMPAPTVGGTADLRPTIPLTPELTVEPLPTLYMRRAISYRFIRTLLEEFFGEQISAMHRRTQDYPAAMNIRAELDMIESLFLGAYAVVCEELAMPLQDEWGMWSTRQPTEDAEIFMRWAQGCGGDEDLSRDMRMMIPMYYDETRQRMKVWAFLGWTAQDISASFMEAPRVVDYDRLEPMSDRERMLNELQARQTGRSTQPQVVYHETTYTVPYPVAVEAYVTTILDREEFQAHCDQFQSVQAIIDNL